MKMPILDSDLELVLLALLGGNEVCAFLLLWNVF